MKCPECGSKTRVLQSHGAKSHHTRKRQCTSRNCYAEVKTREVPVMDFEALGDALDIAVEQRDEAMLRVAELTRGLELILPRIAKWTSRIQNQSIVRGNIRNGVNRLEKILGVERT